MNEIINRFADAMQSSGLYCPDGVIPDGIIHRCKIEGDRGGKKNGWYALHLEGLPAGVFGNWKTGEQQTWCEKSSGQLTHKEKQAQYKFIEVVKIQRKNKIDAAHDAARQKASKLWNIATSVDMDHPYLQAKGIKPTVAKQLKKTLVLPLTDIKNNLHSLQFIFPDGSKRFLRGGKKKGCFTMLGKSFKTICICEGWATGCSIHETTEYSVVVAFDAGNLLSVAQAVRKKYSDSTIIICADDDYQTEANPGITAARTVAQAINGSLAIPTFGENRPMGATDFNDLHQYLGLDKVRYIINAALKQSKSQLNIESKVISDNQWPPILLPGTVKLPEIEADILPGWAGDMAHALATGLQVSEAATILPALSMVATAVQRRYEVAPRSDDFHIEPLCLWGLTILRSGSNKTQVLNALCEPLKRWEKVTGERLQKEITSTEATRRVAKKRIEKLETKAGNADEPDKREELRTQIRDEFEAMPKEMFLPRLMTGDVTPEQLQTMLTEQHERMALISDEAGVFQILSGQYTGGIANLDVFLQSYSGASVRIDRRSRQAVLEKPALTFCLMLQPGILQSAVNDRRFHDSGLLARFLYVIPEDRIGHRDVRKQMSIPDDIRQAWCDGLLDLLTDAESPGAEPIILTFTPEAQECWLDYAQKIENSLSSNGELCNLAEWGSKLAGTCARIAGLIQLVITGRSTQLVEVEAATRAIALCEKLTGHAKAAFQLLGADEIENDAHYLMRWIKENKLYEFNRSYAQKSLEGRFRKVNKLKLAAQRLHEWHVLSVEKKRDNKNARSSPYYMVNPALFDHSMNSP